MGDYADDAYDRSMNEYEEYYRLEILGASPEEMYDAGFSDEYGCDYYPGQYQFAGHDRIEIKASGKGRCPKCGEDTELKEGQFGKFYGCVTFPKCKGSRNFIVESEE